MQSKKGWIRYFILSMIGQSLKINEKRVVILGGKM